MKIAQTAVVLFLLFTTPLTADSSHPGRAIVSAFFEGRYDKVETLLSDLLAEAKTLEDRGRAQYVRGRFEAWLGDTNEAFDAFEKAVDHDAGRANYHFWLGRIYGDRAESASIFRQPGLARNTRKAFERAIELDADHLDARTRLMEYYLHAPGILGGGTEKAYREAEEIKSRNALRGHYAWAIIFGNEKGTHKQESEFRRAHEAEPHDPVPALWLASLLGQTKRRTEATEILERYQAAYATDERVLYHLAGFYRRGKRYKESIDAARHSLAICRDSLVSLRTEDDSFTEAFETTLSLQSLRIQCLYSIGLLSALSGLYPEAGIAALEQVLDIISPDAGTEQAYVYFNLGRIHVHRSEMESARAAFETALRLDEELKAAREALGALKE